MGNTERDFEKTIDDVVRTKPDIIGMTVTCHTSYALKLLDILKSLLPETQSSWGPQVTFTADYVLSDYKSIDFVIRGEGEHTMLKLVNALEGSDPIDLVD